MIRIFQSTLPVWGATAEALPEVQKQLISIHAPRVGSDRMSLWLASHIWISIHAPRVGSDRHETKAQNPVHLISIHAPRVGSDQRERDSTLFLAISIHAPRVGSDSGFCWFSHLRGYFNPRSPCGERRRRLPLLSGSRTFQSTLPVWGATRRKPILQGRRDYFNPRSPCGERLSIRSVTGQVRIFQSTLPVWGATRSLGPSPGRQWHFNPRSPCGERPRHRRQRLYCKRISIHAPRVGSDDQPGQPLCNQCISIHAPRVGSDALRGRWRLRWRNFNPRSPCGERPAAAVPAHFRHHNFNPRSPCGERPAQPGPSPPGCHFNPRSPCGERLRRSCRWRETMHFNPRSPCGERPPASDFLLGLCGFQSTLPVWGATHLHHGFI